MISQQCSASLKEQQRKCYTILHTFEKKNSLSFKLLFGDYKDKIFSKTTNPIWHSAVNYVFESGQIFGFLCGSKGIDFKKFHYLFIIQACYEHEYGTIIPGISPGAKVLVKALNKINSDKLLNTLKSIVDSGVDLLNISIKDYIYLNELLNAKINADYFVNKLISYEKDY
jgi:hypothetical protein